MYDYLLFDLDGTLTDSAPGIINSVRHALEHFGVEEREDAPLTLFVGPPLDASFRKYYGFTPEQAAEAVGVYREYFRPKGMFENSVYPGIPEALEYLKARGKHLIVTTAKPEPFAKQILEHFGLLPYFEFVGGATFEETRTKKSEVIAYVLEALDIRDKTAALMIGDREDDILGARENGLDCAAVLYGYGSMEELMAVSPKLLLDTVQDLKILAEF
ncbi:MAG: HAD family hydrolase [Lachnospiraceae bacterium]|nr:HAD family hydrolase [Lachnospiraceae bacterium]